MTEPNDLPPVGAMVTDADGREWVMRDYCAGPTWTFIADQYPSPRTTSALTALWRMQQERDQLKAQQDEGLRIIRELRQKLAIAGVEGSPPPGGGPSTIQQLLARARDAEARVAELEGTLVGIRDANWRAWWGGSTADDFVEWAKNRARHVLGEVTP